MAHGLDDGDLSGTVAGEVAQLDEQGHCWEAEGASPSCAQVDQFGENVTLFLGPIKSGVFLRTVDTVAFRGTQPIAVG